MTSRTLIVAACFAALAAGCQARKTSTHARAEPKPQTQEEMDREGETLGEAADEAAEETRDAANATVAETKRAARNAAEATRDAADDTLREADRAEDTVLGENEKLPPEPGVDMPETGETPNPDEDATAEVPAPALGTEVTARVENIDRKQSHVVFTVQDDISEIRLQSGKEIKVPFNDLRLLTGMEKEKAIKVLEGADNLKVRVLGVGDAMRIVEIEVPEQEEELSPVRGEEKTF
jgi:hypothetical protein